jgi:NAD(P)-dependent dehydrogenase (short-subunit alcohol dehydrogenase family)
VDEYPNFRLDGAVALVTGAARGLGRAIALALANAGADVALGLRDASTGADLADEIEGLGRRVERLRRDSGALTSSSTTPDSVPRTLPNSSPNATSI